jgi:hypothetical protein
VKDYIDEFLEYRLEAALDDTTDPEESTAFELRCGGPSPFMTYDSIMAAAEKDPLLKTIIKERERMIGALAESFSLPAFGIPDYLIMLKSESKYQRDPFWLQWQQQKLQADASAQWKMPIFTEDLPEVEDINADVLRYITPQMFEVEADVSSVQMSESEMDWEEDEDITEPGLGEGNLDIIAAPTALPFPYLPAAGAYPRVTTDGVGLLDRCYTCATKKAITRFERSATDHVIACVLCLYDHLGWELLSDGTLRKVPADI